MSGDEPVVELLSERFAAPPMTPAVAATDLGSGIRAQAYWAFDHRLEVVVASAEKPPREASARAAWARRLNRRPVPLVLVIAGRDGDGSATVVGPGGDPPPVVTLDPRLIADDLADAARLEPLEVRRRLPAAWERAAGASGLSGIRNRGLLSSHYLEKRVPRLPEWGHLRDVGRRSCRVQLTPTAMRLSDAAHDYLGDC